MDKTVKCLVEGRASEISRQDLIGAKLGGTPDFFYVMYFKGDNFILDHHPTIDLSVAINKIIAALDKLIEECGI